MNYIKSINKSIIISFLIILTLIISGCIGSRNDDSSDGSNTKEYEEAFEFKLLDGTIKNMSEYKGKVVLLDFMGARCPPCGRQMFELERIYNEYSDEELEIVSINVWVVSGENAELVQSLKEAFSCATPCQVENEFPNLYLSYLKIYYSKPDGINLDWTFGLDDSSGTLYFKYASEGVPTLYILDKNGNIYYTKASYTEYSILKNKLDELIV